MKNTTTKDNSPKNFNPKVYRNLSILFIVLGIVNIIVVMFAFATMGYGLWHANDALSYIAKIDSSFNDTNKDILEIELHADDKILIDANINNINQHRTTINDNAAKFRELDLSNVDATISQDFETSLRKVDDYYELVFTKLDNVKNGYIKANVLRDGAMEDMRTSTVTSLHELFDKQDKATYSFFYKMGKSFMLVLLVLISTTVTGLIVTAKFKKHDLKFAQELQASEKKAANYRQRAMYTNIVTGLKNRYALFEQLDEHINAKDNTVLSMVVYNLINFKSVSNEVGRSYVDDYMSMISKKLTDEFGDQVELFSTDVDEFCVKLDDDTIKDRAADITQNVLHMLSQPVMIDNKKIQMLVAGCSVYCRSDAYASASDMFLSIDRSIDATKTTCIDMNQSFIKAL